MGKPKSVGARKATQYRAKQIAPEQQFDRSQSRFNSSRLDSYEDTFGSGDEDQFHLNRDKMLLEDDGGAHTRGGGRGGDDLDEPDTIYDLDLPSSASEDDQDDDEEEKTTRVPRHLREYKRSNKKDENLGRYGHEYDPKQDIVFPSSDDEDDDEGATKSAVDATQLAAADSSDDDDDDGRPSKKKKRGEDDLNSDSDLEQDHERWAAGHYHVSRRAPGEADSEDEEALELEEQEARRLQKKMKDRLDGLDDFALAEDEQQAGSGIDTSKPQDRLRLDGDDDDEGTGPAAAASSLMTGTAAADLSEEAAIALLLRTQPETLALVDDFLLTASKLSQVSRDLQIVRASRDEHGNEHPALAIMELEHQALTTYLPTLAFYFSLLLQPTAPEQELVDKVLARLSSLRGALATMEELDLTSADLALSKSRRLVPPEEMFNLADSDASTDPSDDDDDEEMDEITDSMLVGIDDDELEELMAELGPGDGADVLMEKVRAKQRDKGIEVAEEDDKDDEEEEEEDENEEEEEVPVVAKKATSRKPPTIPTLPKLAPMSTSNPKSARAAGGNSTSAAADLLDPLSLSNTDRADKASKRHTLRFHAAQVEQKASKRDARRRGLEGDDDVPRRSKEQARREVLKRQQHGAAKDAEARARLDGDDFGEDDERDARAVRGEAAAGGQNDDDDGGDGYYDLVAAEKSEGRQAKKARYDEARAAEREEILSLAESAVDGPRAATRKILSNRGLTPKRNKLNRNARVKKRHQYDQKQKKLRSMQATYSGGEARTGYEGERTGISKHNVRSRTLG
ncbi:hypothetical protein RHOSPDRAFT_16686 [Rhodotorula sp. JG-1b]|nr:hypothetical protein RHOSPDRAFT_16686 [Rhodotorula sp. JG-1b]